MAIHCNSGELYKGFQKNKFFKMWILDTLSRGYEFKFHTWINWLLAGQISFYLMPFPFPN